VTKFSASTRYDSGSGQAVRHPSPGVFTYPAGGDFS
jgi:hypothetical protein